MLDKLKDRKLSTALQVIGSIFMVAGIALISAGSFGSGGRSMEKFYEENYYNLDIDEVNEFMRNKEE